MYVMGITPTSVRASTDSPEFKLGTLGAVVNVAAMYTAPMPDTGSSAGASVGPKVYKYVKSASGVSAGQVVAIDGAFDAAPLTTTSGIGKAVGVANATIAAGGYGWIQIYGGTTCNVISGNTAGSGVTASATAGSLDKLTAAGSIPVVGIYLSAVVSTTGTVDLTWPHIAHAL